MVNTNNLVYLAGPIDAAEDHGRGWRQQVSTMLSSAGYTTFNPSTAFTLSKAWQGDDKWAYAPKREIRQINRHALRSSCAVLCYLPDNSRAFGTIREIEYAISRGIPVIVISEWIHDHIDAYDLEVYRGFDEAVDFLVHSY